MTATLERERTRSRSASRFIGIQCLKVSVST